MLSAPLCHSQPANPMPKQNTEIADIFERYAALLEIQGANVFRVRAYRNAARTLRGLSKSVATMLEEGADLTELPGIGDDLAKKIKTIVETGGLAALEKLGKSIPGELADLEALPGLGPKRVFALYRELKVDSLSSLLEAAKTGKIRTLSGFGEKTEKKILEEAERRAQFLKRFPLATAEQMAVPLLRYLRQIDGVKEAVVAGSYRRRKATVGDLDILVTAKKGAKVMDRFVDYKEVGEVVSKGATRSTVRLRSGLQVDLRVVPAASYGAALHYFTGSKAHNIATRTIAVKKGLKLNEYGLYKGDERLAGRTENKVYAALGLPYIEPEMREDQGEIEAAQRGRLPKLISLGDIRGDLHSHTQASDGQATAKEMAQAAQQLGYDYLAISDHTQHVTIAHGLDAKRYAAHIDALERLNENLKGIRILKAAEVDILEDGALDLPESVLKQLDLTVCAIHYKFDLSADQQTDRIIRAMDNPYFNIFAHPTGRLTGKREPYALDMERVMKAALERGCHLELNAQPERLDLSDQHARMAKEMGLKVAISTDAHSTATLDYMRFGIDQARRAWLEPDDVLNTRHWSDLRKLLARK